MAAILLLVQLATTLPLVGLIWTIQIVHYPLFSMVSEGSFGAYHQTHSRRITYLVLPLMSLELASSVALLRWQPAGVTLRDAQLGLALVLLAWGTTAFLSVPAHNRLAEGKSSSALQRLVTTNWLRTAAWTLRGISLLWLASSGVRATP